MHPLDIKKEGFTEGMKVRLDSDTGTMRELTLQAFNIRPHNLLTYFPEANALIPLDADPRSHTPSFKAVQVRITPEPI
jgi:anaerobic selenocysteine-containing dehydrogenase